MLAWLCPWIVLGARRLHDIGRSGWWSLVALTGVGNILLIVWFCRPGEKKAFDSLAFLARELDVDLLGHGIRLPWWGSEARSSLSAPR